jgi:hypothetical protein
MKYKSVTIGKFKKSMNRVFLVLGSMIIFPGISIAQPTDPGPQGGTPDPLSVPFDSRLSLLLLAAGVVFAIIIIRKMQKSKTVKSKVV